jgi:hypothetical protein
LYGAQGDEAKFNTFYESSYQILEVLEQAIVDHFIYDLSVPSYTPAVLQSMLSRILMQVRTEVLSWNWRVRSQGNYVPNIRSQIEDLIGGNDYLAEITLHKFGIKIPLTKDHFAGKDIKIFRDLKSPPSGFEFGLLNDRVIDNRAKILKTIVEQNGDKVRVFIGMNIENVGIQYIKKATQDNPRNTQFPYVPWLGLTTASYIDIDLSNDPQAYNILRDIAKISLLYQPGVSYKTPFFIMKKWGVLVEENYNKMICAFDYRKFYSKDEIYSTYYDYTSDSYTRFSKVTIDNVEGVFNLDRTNDLWGLNQIFYPYSAKNNLEEIPDLNNYF